MKTLCRKDILTNKIRPVDEMIRVVKTKDNNLLLNSKAQGRGAYVWKNLVEFDLKRKTNFLNRSLKMKVNSSIYDELRKIILKEVYGESKENE